MNTKGYEKSTQEEVDLMIWLYRHEWSVLKIGEYLRKDHTTILYWLKKNKFTMRTRSESAKIYKGSTFVETSMQEIKTSIPASIHTAVVGNFKETRQIKIVDDKSKNYDELIELEEQIEKEKNCPHNAVVRGKCFVCGKTMLTNNTGNV